MGVVRYVYRNFIRKTYEKWESSGDPDVG